MTVHVWKDDRYIGQVVASRGGVFASKDHAIDVQAQDEDEGEKVKQLLLGGRNDYLEVKSGGRKMIELEFPGEDWLGITCLMLLPPAGYRVHIIRDANG